MSKNLYVYKNGQYINLNNVANVVYFDAELEDGSTSLSFGQDEWEQLSSLKDNCVVIVELYTGEIRFLTRVSKSAANLPGITFSAICPSPSGEIKCEANFSRKARPGGHGYLYDGNYTETAVVSDGTQLYQHHIIGSYEDNQPITYVLNCILISNDPEPYSNIEDAIYQGAIFQQGTLRYFEDNTYMYIRLFSLPDGIASEYIIGLNTYTGNIFYDNSEDFTLTTDTVTSL